MKVCINTIIELNVTKREVDADVVSVCSIVCVVCGVNVYTG